MVLLSLLFLCDIHLISGNIHTNWAHKNNNNNNTMLIFMGLNKATQKTWTMQEENCTRKDKRVMLSSNHTLT
jgi:hypothetical protein